MRIRGASISDRGAILGFDHLAQVESPRVNLIDRILQSATCLVAELDSGVVAYGALEYTFYDNGFISIVYVDEAHRCEGIGRALMNALASRCKTTKLFTSTNQSNIPMQRLLQRLGYSESGIILNLDAGDPELVYFLDLSPPAHPGPSA